MYKENGGQNNHPGIREAEKRTKSASLKKRLVIPGITE